MKLPVRLPKGLTRLGGKILLKIRTNKPEICVVGGIILGAAAVVMSGVNTWKNKETLQNDIQEIKTNKELVKAECEDKDIVKERKANLVKSRISFGKHVVGAYWLPTVLIFSSGGLSWHGRTILRRELSAMTAVAATLYESYKRLYNKVKEEFGEEKAQELAYGTKTANFIDGETGEVMQKMMVDKKHMISPYAVYFDPGEWDEDTQRWLWKNYVWQPTKIYNILKIRNVQNTWNEILRARGWVLWGEVAEELGFKPDPNWYRTGWIDDGSGKKFIELGVLDGPYQLEINKRFMDEHDSLNVALIDPNVDGCIDMVFDNIETFDYRCGKRAKKQKRIPTEKEMFGDDFANKLGKAR